MPIPAFYIFHYNTLMRRTLKYSLFFILIILLSVGFLIYRNYKFYNSIFRLSFEQVSASLDDTPSLCRKFVECKLQPGDILVRRYITSVNNLFEETLDPYFTHSAYYLGDDEIFEAVGNNVPPRDQITVTKLSESDWIDDGMETFVIIRPKRYGSRLPYITDGLKKIADDPEYVFGPLNEKLKTASCSDLIFKFLQDEAIVVDVKKNPPYITPDFLFLATVRDTENFEIIGYNIAPIR